MGWLKAGNGDEFLPPESGPGPVMFDEQIDVEHVSRQRLKIVSATTVELHLEGTDLITTADLRRGLLSLWLAEADTAGLDIDCWHPMGDGVNDAPGK